MLKLARSRRFAQAMSPCEETLAQDFQAGLKEDRCDQRSNDLTGGAPQPGTPLAQEGETPNAAVRGPVSSAMRRGARMQGLTIRGAFAGGARHPIKLFKRL